MPFPPPPGGPPPFPGGPGFGPPPGMGGPHPYPGGPPGGVPGEGSTRTAVAPAPGLPPPPPGPGQRPRPAPTMALGAFESPPAPPSLATSETVDSPEPVPFTPPPFPGGMPPPPPGPRGGEDSGAFSDPGVPGLPPRPRAARPGRTVALGAYEPGEASPGAEAPAAPPSMAEARTVPDIEEALPPRRRRPGPEPAAPAPVVEPLPGGAEATMGGGGFDELGAPPPRRTPRAHALPGEGSGSGVVPGGPPTPVHGHEAPPAAHAAHAAPPVPAAAAPGPAAPAAAPAEAPAPETLSESQQKLARSLLAAGVLTYEHLERQIEKAGKQQSVLARALLQSGYVREADIMAALVRKLRVPRINLKTAKVAPEVLSLVSPEIAKKERFLPLDEIGDILVAVTPNVFNVEGIEEVRRATGRRVCCIQCAEEGFDALVLALYEKLPPKPLPAAATATLPTPVAAVAPAAGPAPSPAAAAPSAQAVPAAPAGVSGHAPLPAVAATEEDLVGIRPLNGRQVDPRAEWDWTYASEGPIKVLEAQP